MNEKQTVPGPEVRGSNKILEFVPQTPELPSLENSEELNGFVLERTMVINQIREKLSGKSISPGEMFYLIQSAAELGYLSQTYPDARLRDSQPLKNFSKGISQEVNNMLNTGIGELELVPKPVGLKVSVPLLPTEDQDERSFVIQRTKHVMSLKKQVERGGKLTLDQRLILIQAANELLYLGLERKSDNQKLLGKDPEFWVAPIVKEITGFLKTSISPEETQKTLALGYQELEGLPKSSEDVVALEYGGIPGPGEMRKRVNRMTQGEVWDRTSELAKLAYRSSAFEASGKPSGEFNDWLNDLMPDEETVLLHRESLMKTKRLIEKRIKSIGRLPDEVSKQLDLYRAGITFPEPGIIGGLGDEDFSATRNVLFNSAFNITVMRDVIENHVRKQEEKPQPPKHETIRKIDKSIKPVEEQQPLQLSPEGSEEVPVLEFSSLKAFEGIIKENLEDNEQYSFELTKEGVEGLLGEVIDSVGRRELEDRGLRLNKALVKVSFESDGDDKVISVKSEAKVSKGILKKGVVVELKVKSDDQGLETTEIETNLDSLTGLLKRFGVNTSSMFSMIEGRAIDNSLKRVIQDTMEKEGVNISDITFKLTEDNKLRVVVSG